MFTTSESFSTDVYIIITSRYPSRMSSRKVDKVLTEAFSLWSSATSLTFRQQRTGKVHIEIRFERKEHGDEDPFDGKGRNPICLKCNNENCQSGFFTIRLVSKLLIAHLK